MPQQRGAFTDQLDTIVQVIELGRKTGILIVERGGGSKREEGRIDFVLGQVTDAHIGHLHGQEALNWLKTWETCRFIFEPTVVEKNTGPQPKSSPLQSTGPLQSTDPLQSTGPLKNTNPKGHIPSQETQNSQRRTPTGQPNAPSMATGPYRIRQDVDGSLRLLARAGLSRLHRRLFLLIDGHRTIPELVRLLGHSPVEVQKLLRDLETIGLIRH